MIVTTDNFEEAISQLAEYDTWCVDVETNGVDPYSFHQICGVGILGYGPRLSNFSREYNDTATQTYYFPFRHLTGGNLGQGALDTLIHTMNQVPNLMGYNIKFDLRFLEKEGLVIEQQKLIDVIMLVRLCADTEVREFGLTPTITRYFGASEAEYDIKTKKILKENKWNKDFSAAPVDILGPYCEEDVYYTLAVYQRCLKQIQDMKQEQVMELEFQLTRVLYDMEGRGISVDSKYAKKAMAKIDQRRCTVASKVWELSGEVFNLGSSQQVGEIFNEMGIHSPVVTPKGKESWSESALVQINNPIAGLIRQYRSLEKLKSTYLEPYTELDTLHTTFCNWVVVTGRLSSRSPNLQNIPRTHFNLADKELTDEEREVVKGRIEAIVSTKGGTFSTDLENDVLDTWGFVGDESFDESDEYQVAIRRLFVPRDNYSLIGFDYSQMEVRVFLSYLQNEELNELMAQEDIDFHAETAKNAFAMESDNSEFKFYRQMAKNITFGIIYGIGNKRLALQLRTSPKEAASYKRKYFQGIKGSKEFIDKVSQTIEDRGWVRNRYGRLYQIPAPFAYKGVNYLVQGTSADILNERMIKVYDYLKDKKSNMLLQVHDEIVCEIHDEEVREVPLQIQKLLEENSLDIPLKVDIDVCEGSWAVKKDWLKSSLTNEPVSVTLEECIDWS